MGQTGPMAGWPATATSARRSVASRTSSVGRTGRRWALGPYTDYVGPRFSLVALLAALDQRRRTGRGCYIDVSQVEAGVYFQSPEMADNALRHHRPPRRQRRPRVRPARGLPVPGRTAGPERFVAIAVITDEQWLALATAIDRADLRDDPEARLRGGPRPRRPNWRRRHRLDRRAASRGRRAGAAGRGVPAHVSASSRDFCTDPQLAHRGHLVRLAHPLHGTATVEGPRYLLSATPGRVTRAAPTSGKTTSTC